MKTFLIGFSEEEIVNKAEEIIAEELEEKNRKSRFCYTPTEIAKLYNMSGSDLNSFLKDQGIIRKLEGGRIQIDGTMRLRQNFFNFFVSIIFVIITESAGLIP